MICNAYLRSLQIVARSALGRPNALTGTRVSVGIT